MGMHNLTIFCSEYEITGAAVKTHECVVLIRDIYIW